MGADIYGVVQARHGDGPWVTLLDDGSCSVDLDIHFPRDYVLFGAIAGVRSPGPPVVPLRGLPDDVDRGEFEGFHARTWLTGRELWEAVERAEAGETWQAIAGLMVFLEATGWQTRLVCGFD